VVTEPIKTVAVMHNITRQAAADVPSSWATSTAGSGTRCAARSTPSCCRATVPANGLIGLLNRGGISTYAPGSAEARYRSIRHGITMMEQHETSPRSSCSTH
jgi:hypothetical protein